MQFTLRNLHFFSKATDPNPGQVYTGAYHEAYLPNNARGAKVAKLLKLAFERGLTFKVGTSQTTGHENTVVWTGQVPHRTSFCGGPSLYGFWLIYTCRYGLLFIAKKLSTGAILLHVKTM